MRLSVTLRMVVGVAALIACVGFAELFVRQRLERTLREQLGHVMSATVDGSVRDVEIWVGVGLHAMNALAQDRELRQAADACASTGACAPLSTRVAPYLAASGLRTPHLVTRRGHPPATSSPPRPGLTSSAPRPDADARPADARPADARPGLTANKGANDLSEARPGLGLSGNRPGLSPDEIAKLAQLGASARVIGAALDQPMPALLLAAPLGEDLVIVAEHRLAPLSDQISATRIGKNGETCTFDARGRMLTKSRFRSPEQALSGALELREPSADGLGPLTHAVQQAIVGRDGMNLDGYIDFRGVRVVGAYRFLPEHGIGVVSEVDYDNAYRTLGSLSRAFLLLGVILMALLVVTVALYARGVSLRARAEAAERRANRYGQYQIEAKLGEGGMGAVYLASHALLRRKAALKLLRADRSSPDALERFEREVQVTSTLTHPNTVAIYDYGRTEDGTFYYVMEHLDGFDLQRLVALTGPLPQARVLALLRQVCGSLAEAHAAGVVHRDIKPANLFVCTRGGFADTVKVLDFGIVHVGTIDQREEPIVLGTPEYMAPELFESATRASPQSDLYSLGICAYYLLTGAAPFSGGSTLDIGRAHLADPPPGLTELLTEPIDHDLEAAIMACVRKDPSARPSNANALIGLLNRSQLAHQWTQSDAARWWQQHWPVLRLARVSTAPESSKRSIMVSTRT